MHLNPKGQVCSFKTLFYHIPLSKPIFFPKVEKSEANSPFSHKP